MIKGSITLQSSLHGRIFVLFSDDVLFRKTQTNYYILGSLREKFEYSHSDEKALSALFEEFGSSKFAYFEGRSNSQARISGSLAALLAGLLLCWVR